MPVFQNTQALFQSDEEEDNFNWEFKKQFDGEKGQQLFELQSKFKGDKRFRLDERFIENGEEEPHDGGRATIQSLLEEEKKNEIVILEQVLGGKINAHTSGFQQKCTQEMNMLRYDPTQPEHSQYEIRTIKKQIKRKMKDNQQEKRGQDIEDEKVQQPLVSKDIFYKVDVDLKKTLEEQQGFSLLNLFSKNADKEELDEQNEQAEFINKKEKLLYLDHNPFHYDSSDNEEQAQCLDVQVVDKQVYTTKFSESFFLKDDDFRLQEGSDFVRRTASERNNEFEEQRRNLKQIVKAKVRNNHRKSNPFKKRLGGNKKKKFLKMKRALQR